MEEERYGDTRIKTSLGLIMTYDEKKRERIIVEVGLPC